MKTFSKKEKKQQSTTLFLKYPLPVNNKENELLNLKRKKIK